MQCWLFPSSIALLWKSPEFWYLEIAPRQYSMSVVTCSGKGKGKVSKQQVTATDSDVSP